MKKKIITVILAATLVLSMAACNGKVEESKEKESTKTETVQESTESKEKTETASSETTENTETASPKTDEVLSAEQAQASTEATEPEYTKEAVDEVVYATSNVNVRDYPGTSGNVVGSLGYAGEITRTGVLSNDWSEVSYNGGTAYIKSSYLSTSKPEVKSTSNESTNSNSAPAEQAEASQPAETVTVEASGSYNQGVARQVLDLCNNLRAQSGLGSLSWNGTLEEAAKVRAAEASICWSHTRPDGSDWYTVSSATYGENLAKNYGTAQEAVDAWMGSPTHKANIMDGSFTQLGVAFYTTADGKWYWAQEFAY